MRCHYTYDEEAGKVLIPGCMGTAAHGDIAFCTCHGDVETFEQFEREEFNRLLRDRDERIRVLEKEVAFYNRQLRKVLEKRLGKKL